MEPLGASASEMLEVVADRDVWQLNLSCCPRNPHGHERALKEEKGCYRKTVHLCFVN